MERLVKKFGGLIMELTPTLGQKIINETRNLIHEKIIIVNDKAIIIASTDSSRLGDFHEGALQTIQTKSTTILTESHLTTMKGVLPGVNLPITIENKVIGVIGITGNPTEIIPFASLMKKMTEILIRENILVQETEWQSRAKEAYFFEWVQMNDIPTHFIDRGKLLDFHLSFPLRCSIIEIEAFERSYKDRLNEILDLLSLKITCTPIRWGHNRIIFLTEEDTIDLNTLTMQLHSLQSYLASKFCLTTTIGIGTTTNTYVISDSYQKATKALKLGKPGTITAYDELLLEFCLDEVSTDIRKEFTDKIFSSLYKEENVFLTLRSYLNNNMNLKQTASELHIHINTLHYRLNRIEQLTGLNPKSTYAITLFYTALYFLDENLNNKK